MKCFTLVEYSTKKFVCYSNSTTLTIFFHPFHLASDCPKRAHSKKIANTNMTKIFIFTIALVKVTTF